MIGAAAWRKLNTAKHEINIVVKDSEQTTAEFEAEKQSTSVAVKINTEVKSKSTKSHIKQQTTSVVTTLTSETITETETEAEILYIDINSATHDELVKLNGIGDYLAEQIILYREENGGFKNVDELINVSGIGEKIFDKISEYVYVENPVYENDLFVEFDELVETDFYEESEETTQQVTEEITEYVPVLEDYIPIDLNEADVEILSLLPDISEETAQKIIDLREEIGGFSNIYELLFIDDLSDEMFSEIVKYVYIKELNIDNF